nr:TMV resistance protein N-like [Nicotiana tomentosiformis]
MKNMKKLRILNIERSCTCDGSIEYLPNNLRWFVWKCYPWESLPAEFEPKKLVHLAVKSSSLCYLWTGTKIRIVWLELRRYEGVWRLIRAEWNFRSIVQLARYWIWLARDIGC